MSSTELPPDAPSPRFCHLVKWPDFDGYGFNLHAEKSKPGQYIGKVDEGSPAEAAGLRTADRIIEVNGVNIANENHKQVVERIKAVLNETKLLVVDDETDRWYKERKLVIRGNQPNISYLKTPDTRHQTSSTVAQTDQIASENVERDDDEESFKSVEQDSQDNSKTPSVAGSAASTPSFGRKENEEKVLDQPEEKNEVNKTNDSHAEKNGKVEINNSNVSSQKEAFTSENSPKKEISPKNVNETSSAGSISQGSSVNGEKLNLNMSVQEMRAMLASRKKHDPKKDSMDFRQKYAIIQDM